MNTMTFEEFKVYLPLLIPIIILQFGLAIFALMKVLKQEKFPYFNKVTWIFIVLLLQFVGPVCYFVFGRGDSE